MHRRATLPTISSPHIPAADLEETTTVVPPEQTSNVHMFSYIRPHAVIQPRVIHETARVVDFLNAIRP